jgi:hypothetical protein
VGRQGFFGFELDMGSGFLRFEPDGGSASGAAAARSDGWKRRFALFHAEVPTFSAPFSGTDISHVDSPDEVAYCRCRLRTDLLLQRPQEGVYVEVQVLANADNLSLAVVDFEGGGRSSVTFSPETGAVLRERKVREMPRAIEGTYIHLLPAAPPGCRFEGTMGLYLRGGHIAFFRRWRANAGHQGSEEENGQGAADAGAGAAVGAGAAPLLAAGNGPVAAVTGGGGSSEASSSDDRVEGPWETTGFCTDLGWAQGPRLSICLAFRDAGGYRVRLVNIGRAPPFPPGRSAEAYQENKWTLLYGDDSHPLAI